MNVIPYGRQSISQEDIDAVIKVLQADFLTQGPKISEFESSFAKYVNAKYAVAVANGTAALHLCALAMNIKKGDKVITSPITFAASANCIQYAGGEVIFSDIDPTNYLLDLNKVEDLLKKDSLKEIKGIIPVDFTGLPVNTEELRFLADKYNLWIIEDACHAPGGYFKNSDKKRVYCGDGKYSDLSIFSFHPVKHIATGEGGMITTNNKSLYDKLNILRTHGITKDKNRLVENHGGWYYEMQELGYNYRLTDFQAALGVSQLKTANNGLSRRRELAKKYNVSFKAISGILGQSEITEGHAYHLYIIEVQERKRLYEYLIKNNIFAQVHYIPVHLHPYYQNIGWTKGSFPHAERYYERCLSLPMFPTLSDKEQDYVISIIQKYFKENK